VFLILKAPMRGRAAAVISRDYVSLFVYDVCLCRRPICIGRAKFIFLWGGGGGGRGRKGEEEHDVVDGDSLARKEVISITL
jgi:hypothetical protein